MILLWLEIKVVQLYNLCIRQSTVPLTFALVRSNTGAGASWKCLQQLKVKKKNKEFKTLKKMALNISVQSS